MIRSFSDRANRPSRPVWTANCKVPLDPVKEDKNKQIERHTKLGDMFFARHDYTNSLIEFEMVLKADPDNFKGHYMLGKILMGMADYSEALKEFDKMLEIRSTTGDGHFMRAEAKPAHAQPVSGGAARVYPGDQD